MALPGRLSYASGGQVQFMIDGVSAALGLIGPAGMPAAVTQKISHDFGEVLRDDAIVQRVSRTGSEVRALASSEFASFIASDIRKWGGAARASNTRLD